MDRRYRAQMKITRGALWLLVAEAGLSLTYLLLGEESRALMADWLVASSDSVWRQGKVWTLVDDATNDPVTCAEVVAGSVEVISTPVGGGGTGLSDIFDCTDAEGVTDKLPLDSYTVVVEVLEEGTELSLGTSEPRTENLDYGNELIDLGNFEFAFAM